MTKKKSTLKILWKVLTKKIKLRHLVLLVIMLSSNTFAWFIYAQKVSGTVDVHVRSWKILFESNTKRYL